ncbi:Non-reducing end beta-L-arabinofuranosidase [compost metagenome]
MIRRVWNAGDTIELKLPMEAHRVYAHPELRADAGKTAIQRGPLVYCLEAADNGTPLSSIALHESAPFTERFEDSLLGGAVMVKGQGTRVEQAGWSGGLYSRAKASVETIEVTAIPYYLWGNRGSGEMKVWIRESKA